MRLYIKSVFKVIIFCNFSISSNKPDFELCQLIWVIKITNWSICDEDDAHELCVFVACYLKNRNLEN